MLSTDIWKLNYYEETLAAFSTAGYPIGTFRTFLEERPSRYLALRHDIDFDPSLLNNFLSIEENLGFSSSIFFRVCARNYNIFSLEQIHLFERLRRNGHEIGLHLDVEMNGPKSSDRVRFADLQRRVIELAIDHEIDGFSLHFPASNQAYDFADELVERWGISYHTYSNLFFREFKYLSDSGGNWREGHFRDFLGRYDRIQVLTHPIWHYRDCIQENF